MNNLFKAKTFSKKAVKSDESQKLQLFLKSHALSFKNIKLLSLALTHRSYQSENSVNSDNERLEFLGDSILGFVVSSLLYHHFPTQKEGYLAKMKSYVVSEEVLASIALDLGINNVLLLGKGEENSGGRKKKTILADAMEAIIGAIYLDSGFNNAQKFVEAIIIPEIQKVKENRHQRDYKTFLQEFFQKKDKVFPQYKLVSKTGPDHDQTFTVDVIVLGEPLGRGSGKNKKEAQQQAAKMACNCLREQDPKVFEEFENEINSI